MGVGSEDLAALEEGRQRELRQSRQGGGGKGTAGGAPGASSGTAEGSRGAEGGASPGGASRAGSEDGGRGNGGESGGASGGSSGGGSEGGGRSEGGSDGGGSSEGGAGKAGYCSRFHMWLNWDITITILTTTLPSPVPVDLARLEHHLNRSPDCRHEQALLGPTRAGGRQTLGEAGEATGCHDHCTEAGVLQLGGQVREW